MRRHTAALAIVSFAACGTDAARDAAPASSSSASATAASAAAETLDAALAEKLLVETWSARLGVGATNCILELPNLAKLSDKPAPLGLGATAGGITLRGPGAERCTKALEGAAVVSGASCKGDAKAPECTSALHEKAASAYCEPADDPCRLIFACGQASMRDVSVEVTAPTATVRFKVVGTADVSPLDGCPARRRADEDRTWTAKAKLEGGHWKIDGTPESLTAPR